MVKARPIRHHLQLFAVTLLIPLLVFSAAIIWLSAEKERKLYRTQAIQVSETLVSNIDRQIADMKSVLRVLAISPHIANRNYADFRTEASNILQAWAGGSSGNFSIMLHSPNGDQEVRASSKLGSQLPSTIAFRYNDAVSDAPLALPDSMLLADDGDSARIAIETPVYAADGRTHVLSLSVQTEHFAEILRSQTISGDWTIALLDENHRIIARNRNHEQFVGTTATDDLRENAVGLNGTWIGSTKDETPVLAAYSRSENTGWYAAAGVPLAVMEEPVQHTLWALIALAFASVVGSFFLAKHSGKRIAAPVRSLEALAVQLRNNDVLPLPATGVREVDEVGVAIVTASKALRDREDKLRSSEQRLLATRDNAAVGIIEVDASGRVIDVNATQCRLLSSSREKIIGEQFSQRTEPNFLDEDQELFKKQVAGEHETYSIEKQYRRDDGSMRWARVTSTAVNGSNGSFAYAVRIVEDITERKLADIRQAVLIAELNHRVKNTLATVQSIASQTFRNECSETRAMFGSRLMALARAHDLLTQTSWSGADLRDVVRQITQTFQHKTSAFEISGASVQLAPKASLAFSMALHELATNALKYGALSTDDGTVDICWTISSVGGKNRLEFRWQERNGPQVEPPQRTGFGSRLIKRALAAELDGTVTIDYAAQGLGCVISAVLEEAIDPVVEQMRQAECHSAR